MQLPISKEVSDEGDVSIVDANGDPWFEGTGFGTEGAAADLIVRAVTSRDQLLQALRDGRVAIDVLMARLIEVDPSFLPTKSAAWPALVAIKNALAAAEA